MGPSREEEKEGELLLERNTKWQLVEYDAERIPAGLPQVLPEASFRAFFRTGVASSNPRCVATQRADFGDAALRHPLPFEASKLVGLSGFKREHSFP